jgi:hypothetical protein
MKEPISRASILRSLLRLPLLATFAAPLLARAVTSSAPTFTIAETNSGPIMFEASESEGVPILEGFARLGHVEEPTAFIPEVEHTLTNLQALAEQGFRSYGIVYPGGAQSFIRDMPRL